MPRAKRRLLVIQDAAQEIVGSRRWSLTLVDQDGAFLTRVDVPDQEGRAFRRLLDSLNDPPPERPMTPKDYQ